MWGEEDQVELEKQFRKGGGFPGRGLDDVWKGFPLWCLQTQTQGKEDTGDSLMTRLCGGGRLNTSPDLAAHCTSHMGLQGCTSQF